MKTAALTFKREDLLYDIANYCYIEGHIMDEADEHSRHMTKDVVEDGNVDRVNRLLSLYHAKAMEILYPMTKRETCEPAMRQDKIETPPTYTISLDLPDGFSETSLRLLELLVHEYLVCNVVADWLKVTNPSKADAWESRAALAEADINRAKNARRGCTVRKLRPF